MSARARGDRDEVRQRDIPTSVVTVNRGGREPSPEETRTEESAGTPPSPATDQCGAPEYLRVHGSASVGFLGISECSGSHGDSLGSRNARRARMRAPP